MEPQQKKQKCMINVAGVVSSPSCVVLAEQIFYNDLILQSILSYIDSAQYLYIASVNYTFRNVYTTLYPYRKETHFNGSTIEHVKFCYHDTLSFQEKHTLLQCTARQNNVEGLRYLRSQIDCKMILDHKTIDIILKNRYLNVLKWARESLDTVRWSGVVTDAAYDGNIIVLEWLYINLTPEYNFGIFFTFGSIGGHPQTIQWLEEKRVDLKSPIG